MADNDFRLVKNFRMHVFEQKKSEKGTCAILRCAMNGRKNEDGSYGKSLNVTVIVNDNTDWAHADLTGNNIDVDGQFAFSDWEKDGKAGFNFTIFATKVVVVPKAEKKDEKKATKW